MPAGDRSRGRRNEEEPESLGDGTLRLRLFLCFGDGAVDPSLLQPKRYAGRAIG
jgi:hypothetical protein